MRRATRPLVATCLLGSSFTPYMASVSGLSLQKSSSSGAAIWAGLSLAEFLQDLLIVTVRKSEPVGSQFVELLLNAADQAKKLGVGVE